MKKRILTLALLLSIGFSSVFANNEEGISQKATSAFKKEFSQATDVKWESGKEFVKATFEMNGQVMFAYYTPAGELLAVTRNILSSQLPFSLLSDLKNNYKGSWITDLFEIASKGETTYYVTLDSPESVVVLKSSGVNGWEQFKKERKNIDQ
jgi:hypothetical protein